MRGLGLGLLWLLGGCTAVAGWFAPGGHLTFPEHPSGADGNGRRYDVDRDGRVDFAIEKGGNGLLDVLRYDDDEDGSFDRTYRLSDYDARHVPHLVVLIDSIPYRVVATRYAQGDWGWFPAPQKVIAPFPSLTEVSFSLLLGAPPLGGAVERYYDKREGRIKNLWTTRAFGYRHPWQHRLDAQLDNYRQVGYSYLNPRPWFQSEMYEAKVAADKSLHRVTIVYVVSSSAMVSRYGEAGLTECLDRLDQLCLQLLYERQGAIKITFVSDHGHNLRDSDNVPVAAILREAGLNPTDRIVDRERDVVAEIDGLVTYFGVHTSQPARVAAILLSRPEVELAFYLGGDAVVLRSARGEAAIERRGERFRYVARSADVLGYDPVLAGLRASGKADADGFAADEDWFLSTADHEWPDAPARLWNAFHGQVVNPADVMFSLRDGSCAGMEFMERWIRMKSTHGGLNQVNSDGVVLTMAAALPRPLRIGEVMRAVEPAYDPTLLR